MEQGGRGYGIWSRVHEAWCMGHGARSIVHGALVHGEGMDNTMVEDEGEGGGQEELVKD